MKIGEVVRVRTNQGEKRATLVKENQKTIWVKLFKNDKPNIVKRHKDRHLVPIGDLI